MAKRVYVLHADSEFLFFQRLLCFPNLDILFWVLMGLKLKAPVLGCNPGMAWESTC